MGKPCDTAVVSTPPSSRFRAKKIKKRAFAYLNLEKVVDDGGRRGQKRENRLNRRGAPSLKAAAVGRK